MTAAPKLSSRKDVHAIRTSRRHPAITQHNYLHLRALLAGLRDTLADVPPSVRDALDVWCGTRPYEDLLPPDVRYVGLDVEGNPYGVADVVSDELLPFPDASFDLLLCVQAFQYMPDPSHAVAEFARVLRPGGTAVVSLVFADDYDRRSEFEGRYTEQQLSALFAGWEDVHVREDGGRGVAWTTLTGSLFFAVEQRAASRFRLLRWPFVPAYVLVNVIGLGLERLERRGRGWAALPMNLTLTARRPPDG